MMQQQSLITRQLSKQPLHCPQRRLRCTWIPGTCWPRVLLPAGFGPESFRLRTPHQSAGCFLPQYQSQHHLSEQALSRQGLLGVLLHHDGQVRFFSGAEIGSLHGATKPLLLPANSQVQMKLLGGSTAVPQAITCLVHACRDLQVAVPAPDEAVNLVLQHRLRNDNTLFLPLGTRLDFMPKGPSPGGLADWPQFPPGPPARKVPLGVCAGHIAF